MIVLTNEEDVVILVGTELVEVQRNGYPVYREVNGDICAVPNVFIKNTYTVESLPLEEKIVRKYCYTEEQGFYLNPGWEEPNKYGIPEELLEKIRQDQINEITEGASAQ